MGIRLYNHQLDALEKMQTGCILCGGVGSGKSLTSIAYYYLCNDGCPPSLWGEEYIPMNDPMDLYIITTARKRDTKEWEAELVPFLLHPENNLYSNKVVIDSWNNIGKYVEIKNAFFIFDEQRVVGYGAWTKSFLRITKSNDWILLSATPGDTWIDYIPVFIANGFYRNKTDFIQQHVIWKSYSKFPQVDRYYNVNRLIRLRDSILVTMDFNRSTESHNIDIMCDYNKSQYKEVMKTRFDIFKNKPIMNAADFCQVLRKIVNSDISRLRAIEKIMEERNRVIVFYTYDYELELLKNGHYGYSEIAEWNGHKHQPIPESKRWIYFVQYNAGAEGWNCIKTDTIAFFSQTYSYKSLVQSMGRIDRLNTPYTDLYYYHLKSTAPIDIAITRALKTKKKFNETKFINGRL